MKLTQNLNGNLRFHNELALALVATFTDFLAANRDQIGALGCRPDQVDLSLVLSRPERLPRHETIV